MVGQQTQQHLIIDEDWVQAPRVISQRSQSLSQGDLPGAEVAYCAYHSKCVCCGMSAMCKMSASYLSSIHRSLECILPLKRHSQDCETMQCLCSHQYSTVQLCQALNLCMRINAAAARLCGRHDTQIWFYAMQLTSLLLRTMAVWSIQLLCCAGRLANAS